MIAPILQSPGLSPGLFFARSSGITRETNKLPLDDAGATMDANKVQKEQSMGATYAELLLANDARTDVERVEITALVDTDVPHLCIPEHVAVQLHLKDTGVRELALADGHARQVRYVSSIRIELLGRTCVMGALVLGDQVLLGAIPIADMDLIVEPAKRRVTVNPNSPNIPMSPAKGI